MSALQEPPDDDPGLHAAADDPWADLDHDPWVDNPPQPEASRTTGDIVPTDAPPDLFRRWTPAELKNGLTDLEWNIRGVTIRPTYGQIAGELKTLKTYIATMLMVSQASGVPLFGRFDVDHSGHVLAYIGEGGRQPFTRRLVRVTEAMGVDIDNMPMTLSFDVSPFGSLRFEESLERDLEKDQPELVMIDPLYAFHGTKVDASQLHQEGALLSALSATCGEAGASLLIANHFNQTGTGKGLKRITQAGSGEWVDSWILTAHREDPDVGAGLFRLAIDIGSRQWGGTSWDLDLNIGRLDPNTGTHDGAIEWDIRPAAATDKAADRTAQLEPVILRILRDHPFELTETQVLEKVGGKAQTARQAWAQLVDDGTIIHSQRRRQEGNRTMTRVLWGTPLQAAEAQPS